MPAAPNHTVDTGSQCARCGYCLHGLAEDARCPECGLRVDRSLPLPGGLPNVRPSWLDTVATGARLLAMAYLIPVIAVLLSMARFRFGTAVEQAIAIAVSGLFCAGVWLLTEPEHSHAWGPARGRVSRSIHRWACRILRIVCLIVPLVVLLFAIDPDPRNDAMARCVAMTSICTAPAPVLQFLVLRYHAARMGYGQLRTLAAVLAAMHGAAMLALVSILVFHDAPGWNAAASCNGMCWLVACLGSPGVLLVFASNAVRMAGCVREARKQVNAGL